MQNKSEKRSLTHKTVKPHTHHATTAQGVGGRQNDPCPPVRGGGYQNICAVLNFLPDMEQKKRDPRLNELREMGLQSEWLDVVEIIGVDAFLKIWRVLDRNQASIDNNGRLLVPLRRYSTFMRYQRNRYIETLNNAGIPYAEIREKLSSQLGEKISINHISRVINRR